MLARPLNLEAHLRRPPRSFDLIFLLDGCLIVLFFVLLGSRFVLAPGIPVLLPESSAAFPGASASLVVSMQRDNMIVFQDGLYDLNGFRLALARAARQEPNLTLLVRADRQVSIQAFMDLCAAARAAGVIQVQLAGDQPLR
jgi:biopolymer transport protein ExbD